MLSDKLTKMPGTSKDSVFHAIAETPEVVIGVRVFNDAGTALAKENKTILVLRVRVVAQDGLPHTNFKGWCDKLFPKVKDKWTGGSSEHVSLAGAVLVPRHQYDAPEVVAMLAKDDAGGAWYRLLKDSFGLTALFLTEAEFTEFYLNEVRLALGLNLDAAPSAPVPCTVLDFAKYKEQISKPYSSGVPTDAHLDTEDDSDALDGSAEE